VLKQTIFCCRHKSNLCKTYYGPNFHSNHFLVFWHFWVRLEWRTLRSRDYLRYYFRLLKLRRNPGKPQSRLSAMGSNPRTFPLPILSPRRTSASTQFINYVILVHDNVPKKFHHKINQDFFITSCFNILRKIKRTNFTSDIQNLIH